MKITLIPRKPRNPLVAASHQRLAGAHQRSASAQRHQAQQALRRELGNAEHSDIRHPQHSP